MRRPFTGVAVAVTGLDRPFADYSRADRKCGPGRTMAAAAPGRFSTSPTAQATTSRVVDAETHRVIGSIETGTTPHGLVASPDGRRIYITGETDDDVVAIDTTTAKVLWKAPVGEQPNEPALTADGRHVYVPIRMSDVADVVDTDHRKADQLDSDRPRSAQCLPVGRRQVDIRHVEGRPEDHHHRSSDAAGGWRRAARR